MGLCSFVPMGRMGNFYFECMTCYAYCKKHGLEFSVPSHSGSDFWNPIYCRHLIHPTYVHPFQADVLINETQHNYSELPFEESWRNSNILFSGYFQSEKYFIDCREMILKDFGFQWELKEGYISLHIRLTDYKIHADRHHNISDEYIKNALYYLLERGFFKVLVFSDEIEEAKQRVNKISYPDFQFEYSVEQNEETDLYLGSCCQHSIIAASTFSWFQAWLGRNDDKIVIAPKTWFEGENKRLAEHDIIPERWIKM